MTRTLALKELRETIGLVGLGLIVYAIVVLRMMGVAVLPLMSGSSWSIPFVGGDFLLNYAVVSACLAITLGLRQSAWEPVGDTYQFLLHRPISRRQVILTKLMVGLGLYLICSALPILVFAWWAATPGMHPSPFEWSMTGPAWEAWLATTVLYFGGFLSGIRPARWVGTRLVPLPAVCIPAVMLPLVPYWILGLVAVILLNALLTATILFVTETRDF